MPVRWRGWLLGALLLVGGLAKVAGGADGGPGLASRPQLLEPSRAPAAVRIIRQVALEYRPQMSLAERERDFLQKAARARSLLDVIQLKELRRQTLALIPSGAEVSWEALRRRRWLRGDQVGVILTVPVWVPARAKRVSTYCGFEKKWQTVAQELPRASGYVWFVGTMAEVNDKAHFRSESIQVEVNSRFAPLAALFLEYIFREGFYDVSRRVPLLVVRGGEDTYAASEHMGPVAVECLSFPDDNGNSLAAAVALCHYKNLAEIYHGRHAAASNHRLGLALDLNDFNFKGVVDGPPNPISLASRQYNRDALHKLDARQLPGWVYTAAKWLGFRLPQEWLYFDYHTDWAHFDVGRLK
jgi:hypothetical protein